MKESIPAHREINGYEFTPEIMEKLLKETKIAGALNKKEFRMLKNMPATKIVAATAYFAGCPNPDQVAVLRLIDLLTAMRNKKLFNHRPGQSIRDRLLPGKCYPGGMTEVIETAFALLELNSLNDHQMDQHEDREKGKYNPVGEKVVSFFNNRKVLLVKLQQYPEIVARYQALFKTDITIINWWSS